MISDETLDMYKAEGTTHHGSMNFILRVPVYKGEVDGREFFFSQIDFVIAEDLRPRELVHVAVQNGESSSMFKMSIEAFSDEKFIKSRFNKIFKNV